MTLEELLLCRLTNCKPLTSLLAVYADDAAIFYQISPDDRKEKWGESGQYPRVVYTVDMQANQERKSAGSMVISLLCDERGLAPEEIEPIVKGCFKDLLIKPEDASPYCFAWSRTDAFEMSKRETGADTRVYGVEVWFDILEYPSQETTDPDPVVALNRYIQKKINGAFILGLDYMEYFKTAGVEAPIFYSRLESVEKSRITNTVAWMDVRIAVHVLCPSAEIRLKLIMSLANFLSLDSEVIMLDGSPMQVSRLQVNNRADYLKDGQLIVTVHYGVLRYKEKKPVIEYVSIEL